MTTRPPTSGNDPGAASCSAFDVRLSAWLEGGLDDADRLTMERHRAECATCAALMADLDLIVDEAAALPVLTPSRDLWGDIEAKLAAPVIPLGAHRGEALGEARGEVWGGSAAAAGASRGRQRSVSVQWLAVAATMLVAVSSGLTWTVARASFGGGRTPESAVATTDAPRTTTAGSASGSTSGSPSGSPLASPATSATPPVASSPALASSGAEMPRASVTSVVASGERGGVVLRAASMTDVDGIYEREIAALRRIVDERFAELDSGTVTELRNNLRTIDRAIEDSRRALSRDPRSRVLSSELDRTLEAKLSLMRRVALL